MEHLKVYIPKEERSIAEAFLEIYEPYSYQGTLNGNLKESKRLKADTQLCRFCKKTRVETTFKGKPHLFSRLLGNSCVYSYDECDECNKNFNPLETELAASFGAYRLFDHIVSEHKPPGFESGSGKVRMKKLPSGNIILSSKSGSAEDLKVDLINGTAKIFMTTQPYRPEFIYRSILKMALAMLPAADLVDYDLAFRFLLNPNLFPEMDKLKSAVIVEAKLVIGRPFGVIFKKKTEIACSKFSKHIFCFFFGHFMFQISIPGHSSNTNTAQTSDYFPAPYFQLDAPKVYDDIIDERSHQLLNSTEKIKRDMSMQFQFATDNLTSVDLDKSFLSFIEKKVWD